MTTQHTNPSKLSALQTRGKWSVHLHSRRSWGERKVTQWGSTSRVLVESGRPWLGGFHHLPAIPAQPNSDRGKQHETSALLEIPRRADTSTSPLLSLPFPPLWMTWPTQVPSRGGALLYASTLHAGQNKLKQKAAVSCSDSHRLRSSQHHTQQMLSPYSSVRSPFSKPWPSMLYCCSST